MYRLVSTCFLQRIFVVQGTAFGWGANRGVSDFRYGELGMASLELWMAAKASPRYFLTISYDLLKLSVCNQLTQLRVR